MNKKFSTLVAALLASGGLFYAVDAMILPAVDGGAKYVMVQTRTASPAEYTVKGEALGEGLAFADAKIWKGKTGGSGAYLVTDKKSYIGKAATGEVVLLPGSAETAPDGAVAFAFEGENLQSGSDYLIVNTSTGALSLKAAPDAGEAFVGVFTAEGVVAKSASTTDAFALGQNVKTVDELGSQLAVKFNTTAVAKLEVAEQVSDGSFGGATEMTVVDGKYLSFKNEAGDELYWVNDDAAASNKITFTTDINAASEVEISSNELKFKSGTNAYIKKAGDGSLINSLGQGSDGDRVYVYKTNGGVLTTWASDFTSITTCNLAVATASAGANVASSACTPVKFTKETTAYATSAAATATIAAGEVWTVNADGKISTSGHTYLQVNSTDLDLAANGDAVFSLGEDGVLMCGDKYVKVENNKLTLADANSEDAAYLYAAEEGNDVATISVTPSTGTIAAGTYVIAKSTKTQVDLTTGAQVLTATEKAATPADPAAGADLTEAPAATTPVLVKLGDNLLIVDGGKVKTIAATDWSLTDGAKAAAASWLVKDGKYESVALKNAGEAKRFLDVAPSLKAATPAEATAFALTADGGTFAYYTNASTTTTAINGDFKFGYTKSTGNVFFSEVGAQAENYAAAVKSKLAASSVIAQAPENTTHEAYNLVKNDGNYYLLSVDGGQNYLSWDGETLEKKTSAEVVSAENLGAVSAKDVTLKKVLWKVTESTFGGVKHYTLSTVASTTINLSLIHI